MTTEELENLETDKMIEDIVLRYKLDINAEEWECLRRVIGIMKNSEQMSEWLDKYNKEK